MSSRRCFTGRPAAPGLAYGPVVRLAVSDETVGVARNATGKTVEDERRAFDAARERASASLRGLATNGAAADILSVQFALLEDPALLDPIHAAIARGVSAAAAWRIRLDKEIAEWAGTDGPADDLRDLRDRVLAALAGKDTAHALPGRCAGAILVGRGLTPSAFVALASPGGIAVTGGTPLGHLAILARARGVPLITGLDPVALEGLEDAGEAMLDAEKGRLILSPDQEDRAPLTGALEAPSRSGLPPQTTPARPIRLCVNIDRSDDLDAATAPWDAVGLMRSEALYAAGPPDEATQLMAYRAVLDRAQGRPVVIRVLDAGGDKPLAWLDAQPAPNPALGLRGVRLLLARPALLRTQFRALARAAASGPLSVLLPFVTLPEELAAARAYLETACDALHSEGLDHARPPLGVMIETPAAALTAASFPADFLAIGSNDLAQHLMAAGRDDPAVAAYHQPRHPALRECLIRCVAAGRARRVPVSLCGEIAADPDLLSELMQMGLTSVSVPPALLGSIAAQIGHGGCAA